MNYYRVFIVAIIGVLFFQFSTDGAPRHHGHRRGGRKPGHEGHSDDFHRDHYILRPSKFNISKNELAFGINKEAPGGKKDPPVKRPTIPEDSTSKKHRPDVPARPDTGSSTDDASLVAGASGGNSGSEQKGPPGAECFMKHPSNNKNPTTCSEEKAQLLSLADIASESADYSEMAVDNEADLILSRGDGLFHWKSLPLEKIFVCQKHYIELGRGWKRHLPQIRKGNDMKNKCNIPKIVGATDHIAVAKARPGKFVSKEQSEAVLATKKIFVPLGTAACDYHHNFLSETTADYMVVRKGYQLRTLIPKSLAESPALPSALGDFIRFHNPTCPASAAHPDDDDDESFSSQSSSQASSQDSVRAAAELASIKNMQELIKGMADEAGIDKADIHFTNKFMQLVDTSKRRRVRTVRRLVSAVCKAFASDNPEYFEQLVYDKTGKSFSTDAKEEPLQKIIKATVGAFKSASSAVVRQQVLSLIAPFVPLSEIQSHLPGLSPYYYKRARLFAKRYKPGVLLQKPDTHRTKYDEKQVISFIEFITSPHIIVDLPFGTSTVKYSDGQKEQIPNTVRILVNERIVQQYLSTLDEQQEKLALKRTTLLRILDYCTAKTRKVMNGLDSFTFAGTEGFDTLISMTGNIAAYADDDQWLSDVTSWLKDAGQYFKSDFKQHVKPASRIADHCSVHAISDPNADAFSKPCLHQHDLQCERCEALKSVLVDIKQHIETTNFPTDQQKQEMLYNYEHAVFGIIEWKKHIVRTIRQDTARTDILLSLKPNEVYVNIDWAMKFLPLAGSADQPSWYGQRGISWHVAHLTSRHEATNEYRTRVYVHVFENVAQDSWAVIAILGDLLKRVKQELPHVTDAYLRSDNAGCYHGSITIAAVHSLFLETQISINRWDFSDPQSGKGPSDRAAAWVKRQVRLFAAEGNKCTTAGEFITCANSYKGVKSTSFIYSSLPSEKRAGAKIPGISQFSNFLFENFGQSDSRITAWKAYKIGIGAVIDKKYWADKAIVPQLIADGTMYSEGNTELLVDDDRYWKAIQKYIGKETEINDAADSPSDSTCSSRDDPKEQAKDILFTCPEPGCTKVYQTETNLLKHLDKGSHKFQPERITLRDFAIGTYKAELEGLRLSKDFPPMQNALRDLMSESGENTILPKGWAMRTRKPCTVFSASQRKWLTAKFDEGERTGRKLDPRTIAKEMRSETQFQKDDWLQWSQIASFWSRLARVRRSETISDLDADDIDEEPQADQACSAEVEDDPHFNTIDQFMYDTIHENLNDIFQ